MYVSFISIKLEGEKKAKDTPNNTIDQNVILKKNVQVSHRKAEKIKQRNETRENNQKKNKPIKGRLKHNRSIVILNVNGPKA